MDYVALGPVFATGSKPFVPPIPGTTLHGVFESDAFRAGFLVDLAVRRGKRFVPAGVSFAAARLRRFDVIADAIEQHLDVTAICELIASAFSRS